MQPLIWGDLFQKIFPALRQVRFLCGVLGAATRLPFIYSPFPESMAQVSGFSQIHNQINGANGEELKP